jgi:diguanylate cyclase (GGDEF)-like protein
VLKNRQPLLIEDLEKDFRFSAAKRLKEHFFESSILAPLLLESAGSGVLRIDSFKKNTFTMDDLRLLQVLAGLASTALVNSFLYSRTEELAIRDSLTGLYVHRYFKERLAEECGRVKERAGRRFALLLFDLDYFKKFNDYFGHTAGDLALQKIAEVIAREVGARGLTARYGGEEFAVILHGMGRKEAGQFAERLRGKIEDIAVKIRDRVHRFTVSGGCAEFPEEAGTEEELIRVADTRLYRAKQGGRNQICCAPS